jgi:RND family efflux transporter MFP subunit
MKTQNKKTMKNLRYILIIPVASLMTACGGGEEHKVHELDPIKVEIGEATVSTEAKTISVSGRIEAGNSANLSTRMMGNVTNVKVQPGQKVKKGELLVAISSTDLSAKKAQVEASIKQAQAAFNDAQRDYQRFKELYEKESASQKEFEGMQTRYQMAEAGLEAAKEMMKEVDAQFAYANLRAPFDGVAANTFVKEGDIAHPGMPIVTVEGTSKYEATVLVPESKINEVQVGAKASILVKSENREIDGVVKEVSPSSKNTGGQFIVKIDLQNVANIRPGMFINAEINAGEGASKSSPLVSANALVRNGQLSGVYALGADNTAILRWIRTGNELEGKVEVLSGISEGEKYILRAEGKLFNGAKVLQN